MYFFFLSELGDSEFLWQSKGKCGRWIKWNIFRSHTEEPSSRPKLMWDLSAWPLTIFVIAIRWLASQGKVALLTPVLVHSRCIAACERSYPQELRPLWQPVLSYVAAFLSQVPPFGDLFILGLSQTFPSEEGREYFKDTLLWLRT